MTRQDKLDFIYRHAQPDHRSVLRNGERALLVLGPDGAKAKHCPLFLLPDHVVEERYLATVRRLQAVEAA